MKWTIIYYCIDKKMLPPPPIVIFLVYLNFMWPVTTLKIHEKETSTPTGPRLSKRSSENIYEWRYISWFLFRSLGCIKAVLGMIWTHPATPSKEPEFWIFIHGLFWDATERAKFCSDAVRYFNNKKTIRQTNFPLII